MLGFLQSPQRKIKTETFEDSEILKFTNEDCNGYLINTHTDKELCKMKLEDKRNLILDLEYNFKNNSI